MKFVYGRPDRNVNMLAGVVHSHAGQWHPVLPADQSADALVSRPHRTQATTVAITPYHSLGVGWHQLAVMIPQLCLGRNRKQTVVKSSVSRAGFNTLVYSYHDPDFQIASRFTQSSDFGTGNGDAVLS
jgi:hypothetical protein